MWSPGKSNNSVVGLGVAEDRWGFHSSAPGEDDYNQETVKCIWPIRLEDWLSNEPVSLGDNKQLYYQVHVKYPLFRRPIDQRIDPDGDCVERMETGCSKV